LSFTTGVMHEFAGPKWQQFITAVDWNGVPANIVFVGLLDQLKRLMSEVNPGAVIGVNEYHGGSCYVWIKLIFF